MRNVTFELWNIQKNLTNTIKMHLYNACWFRIWPLPPQVRCRYKGKYKYHVTPWQDTGMMWQCLTTCYDLPHHRHAGANLIQDILTARHDLCTTQTLLSCILVGNVQALQMAQSHLRLPSFTKGLSDSRCFMAFVAPNRVAIFQNKNIWNSTTTTEETQGGCWYNK